MTPDIDIAHQSDLWPSIDALIKTAAQATLTASDAAGELSIVLADDAFIQALNKQYRDKDKPTNVLSFPQDDPGLLGDVILAYETVAAEAEAQNKSLKDHVTHLIVHGILHLIGHDHEEDGEAETMEALEIAVLSNLGIKNPYET